MIPRDIVNIIFMTKKYLSTYLSSKTVTDKQSILYLDSADHVFWELLCHLIHLHHLLLHLLLPLKLLLVQLLLLLLVFHLCSCHLLWSVVIFFLQKTNKLISAINLKILCIVSRTAFFKLLVTAR